MKHSVTEIYSLPISLPFFTIVYRAGIKSERGYSLVEDEQKKQKEMIHFCT